MIPFKGGAYGCPVECSLTTTPSDRTDAQLAAEVIIGRGCNDCGRELEAHNTGDGVAIKCPQHGRVSYVMSPSPLRRIPYLHRVDWRDVPVWSHTVLKLRERGGR